MRTAPRWGFLLAGIILGAANHHEWGPSMYSRYSNVGFWIATVIACLILAVSDIALDDQMERK